MQRRSRLYLALSHRYKPPGFQWSILLATHDEVSQTLSAEQPDATRWDVIDINEAPEPDSDTINCLRSGPPEWRRREEQISQAAAVSTGLIGRFLLAKIAVAEYQAAVARIQAALATVPVEGDDRVWALRAVQALQAAGVINLAGDVRDSADLEKVVLVAGEEVVDRIQRRRLEIRSVRDIPVGELRKGWWRKIV
ncbi:hypothetical protein DENSPDRAFT_668611 [Dentipellis sp. KUC8613]|nr:hypothetical protein DENSPDRAFT_668611 [Dentipellis sp. KUC8613]